MKKQLAFENSDRVFQLWEYQVSHGQLLIRSPMTEDATPGQPEYLTNIDLHFVGVEYVSVPRFMHGLELPPTHDEIREVEGLLGKAIPPEWIRIVSSQDKRFMLVACGLEASENDWELFESPLEFRAIYRDRP